VCGGVSEQPIDIVPTVDPPTMTASFVDVEGTVLAGSGDYSFDSGHGMSVDAEFGTITVGTTAYEVRQITINFPSNRRSMDGNQAEGEMHIIMQKTGSLGIFDLAVVAVMLQLKEEGAVDDPTREFFLNLGLESLPHLGEPKAINRTFNLNAFLPAIEAGSVMMPNCSSYVPWYVLATPAWITGSIMQSFLDGPVKTPAPTFWNQTLINMTVEEQAAAYFAAGLNPDGTPLMSEEQQAIIAAGPVPDFNLGSVGPAPPGDTAPTPTAVVPEA
jgi:carbonic anhydrase